MRVRVYGHRNTGAKKRAIYETYKKLFEEVELVHSRIAAIIMALSETYERTAPKNRNVYIANCNQLILHLHCPWSSRIFPFCARRRSVMLGRWTMDARIQDNIVMRLNHGFFRYRAYLITLYKFAEFLFGKKKILIFHMLFFNNHFADLPAEISVWTFRKIVQTW